MLHAPHTPAAPVEPLTLNVTELAIALYRAHPGRFSNLGAALVDAITDLGGIDQVRQLARTWTDLNTLVIYDLISREEYDERMAVHWPDSERLQNCNTLAFGLKACMRRP